MTPADLISQTRPDSLQDARAVLQQARSGNITYFPSPVDWREEVLYFLLPDRFSDGKEASRDLLTRQEIETLRNTENRPDWNWKNWADSGKRWQGGTIRGIQGRLEYLSGLGITSIWIGPVFHQRARLDTYHGYGIQDFLEIDPRFGTRRELADLVAAAHDRGIRVILDIIVNHSGDNWGYLPPQKLPNEAINQPSFRGWPDFYGNPFDPDTKDWDLAWRNEQGQGFTTDAGDLSGIHDGVWPGEFQTETVYTRAGMGSLGAGDIADRHAENKRTDFYALKDFALDVNDTLRYLVEVFQYWIAITDCDGFRLDTVKHMAVEETRNFCGAVREFADHLGKRNFFIVGEIAGGDFFQDFVLDHLGVLEKNLSAALDIGSARLHLHAIGKGLQRGTDYLEGFKEDAEDFGSHRFVGERHVSILDDHDHVMGSKIRFSSEIPDDSPVKDFQVTAPTALQLFTLGIPCIYYGTEQAFAGPAHSQLRFVVNEGWNDGGNHGDRYLREAIFGPKHPRAEHTHDLPTQLSQADTSLPGFGPFGTAGKHCFDPESPAYVRIAHLCEVRKKHMALKIGRQYARQVRLPHTGFEFPASGEIVAWSRILSTQEALVVVNANGREARGGDVVISAELWQPGMEFTVVANTAQAASAGTFGGSHPIGSKVTVRRISSQEPAFVEMRGIPRSEAVVLVAG
jgi:glycosidase